MIKLAWLFFLAAIATIGWIRIDGYELTEMALLVEYWKQWLLMTFFCICFAGCLALDDLKKATNE